MRGWGQGLLMPCRSQHTSRMPSPHTHEQTAQNKHRTGTPNKSSRSEGWRGEGGACEARISSPALAMPDPGSRSSVAERKRCGTSPVPLAAPASAAEAAAAACSSAALSTASREGAGAAPGGVCLTRNCAQRGWGGVEGWRDPSAVKRGMRPALSHAPCHPSKCPKAPHRLTRLTMPVGSRCQVRRRSPSLVSICSTALRLLVPKVMFLAARGGAQTKGAVRGRVEREGWSAGGVRSKRSAGSATARTSEDLGQPCHHLLCARGQGGGRGRQAGWAEP